MFIKYLHLNIRQADNKLRRQTFLDDKINLRKHNIHGPMRHDIIIHDFLNLCRRSMTMR